MFFPMQHPVSVLEKSAPQAQYIKGEGSTLDRLIMSLVFYLI